MANEQEIEIAMKVLKNFVVEKASANKPGSYIDIHRIIDVMIDLQESQDISADADYYIEEARSYI